MNKDTPVELVEHDIHPDDTLVFIHIPKAGGITLGTLIDPMGKSVLCMPSCHAKERNILRNNG